MSMERNKFKELLKDESQKKESRLILALDIAEGDAQNRNLKQKYLNILSDASDSIVAVKVGYPLVLKTGLNIITEIKEESEVPVIADFKIADIPHVNRQIARYALEAGADGVISHGFVGKDSLQAVVEIAEELGNKGVIVVPTMSHEGGKMFIKPNSESIIELAKKIKTTGIIGPATRPEDVEKLRSLVGKDMLILTPGIGAQGAAPGDAIKSGADYEIVGRAIYTSELPGESAERIRQKINNTVEEKFLEQ